MQSNLGLYLLVVLLLVAVVQLVYTVLSFLYVANRLLGKSALVKDKTNKTSGAPPAVEISDKPPVPPQVMSWLDQIIEANPSGEFLWARAAGWHREQSNYNNVVVVPWMNIAQFSVLEEDYGRKVMELNVRFDEQPPFMHMPSVLEHMAMQAIAGVTGWAAGGEGWYFEWVRGDDKPPYDDVYDEGALIDI